MSDENLGQYSMGVVVDFSQFSQAISDAVGKLTSATGTMTSSMSSVGSKVEDTMKNASDSTKRATTQMAESMEQSVSKMSSAIDKMKNVIGGIGIGIVTAFGTATKGTLDFEKQLIGLSRTSGLTAESASKLAYSASQFGVSNDELSRNIGILSRNLGTLEKDADSTTNVFNRFKINLQDGNKKLLPTEDILMNIADKFKSMPNGVEKTGLAMQLFGRQGQQMIPMLNQGSAGLKKMGMDAEKLGLVIKDTSAFTAYNQAQKQWNATLKSLEIQMGNAVLPALTAFSNAIVTILQAFNNLDPGLKSAIISITAVVGSVAALTFGWGAMTAALTAFGGPFAKIGSLMAGMPNLLTGAITGFWSLSQSIAASTIELVKYVVQNGVCAAVTKTVTGTMAILKGLVIGGTAAWKTYVTAQNLATAATVVFETVLTAGIALLLVVIVAVAGLAVAWYTNFNGMREATAGTLTSIGNSFNSLWEHIKEVGAGIWKILKGVFTLDTDLIKEGLNTAVSSFKASIGDLTNIGKSAWSGVQIAGSTIWGGLKKSMGLGGGGTTDTNLPTDFGDFSPGAGGGGGNGGGGGSGESESAYEIAKRKYEQEINLANFSNEEKLAKYHEYLDKVEKLDKERLDFQKGLHELDNDSFQDSLKKQENDLEVQLSKNLISQENYLKKQIDLKKQFLDKQLQTEIDNRKAVDALKTKKVKSDDVYIKEIQNTLWYKEALKGLLDEEKKLTDYQFDTATKIAEYRKQLNLDQISDEEKRYQIMYDQGQINQAQLLVAQKQFEDQRFKLESDSMQKSVEDNAINTDKMKADYLRYIAARTDADKQIILVEMAGNSKNSDDLINTLKNMENTYSQYIQKLMDLNNKLKKEATKNANEVKDTLTSSISQAFQDILGKATTFTGAIHRIWSNMLRTVLKQFTDAYAKSITDKNFSKLLGKSNVNVDNNRIISEKITQAGITAQAAIGNAQRVANGQVAAQEEIGTTQAKTLAEENLELSKDAVVTFSAQAAGQAAVQSIQASLQAMISMLPMLLLMGALTGMLGGKSKTTESTGPGVNLGRNPDSYYKTPTWASSLPSFDVGSWKLPFDTLAKVHKDEMIVPAKGGIADNMRNLLSGGLQVAGASSNNQTINLTYSAAHYGRTNKDVQDEMKQNAKYMVKMLAIENRNFNRGKK